MSILQFPLENKPKIVVVGAGLSGLTAAYRLQQQEHDVHVYEARHRPGGRVLSVKIGDSYEELGGQNFLHGDNAKYSLDLINEVGLETLYYESPLSCLYTDGEKSTSLSALFSKFTTPPNLWRVLEEEATRAHNLQEVIDNLFQGLPELGHVFTLCLTTYEGSEPAKLDSSCIDSLYELFSLFRECLEENSATPDGMKRITLRQGNAQLPLALANKLKNKIHYGAVLTAVHRSQEKIVLTFNKDQEVTADVVLLTIPCPVFHDIKFGPGTLPKEQLSHILNVQYGTNAKILIPVTLKDKKWEFFLHIPYFVSWLNDDDRVMTLYSGGTQGIFDGKGAETMMKEGSAIIQIGYGEGTISEGPLKHANDTQYVSYTGAVFKSWVNDPYAKGSYSNRGIGTTAVFNELINLRGEEVRNIFKPADDQIFFAGEHTTTLPILGTMESAIESGERMARLIAKSIENVPHEYLGLEIG